jgi:RimJ/RimL family protein N-acetyltransferase
MQVVVDESVIGYVENKLKVKISPPSIAIGFAANDGRALCACVFNGYNHSNIDVTIVAEPGGLTRGVLRYIADYVFKQLNCQRMTAYIKKRNKRALKMAPRFGFQYEMVAKKYFRDDDAVMFRMTNDECRWL